jgi:hypothetical protein
VPGAPLGAPLGGFAPTEPAAAQPATPQRRKGLIIGLVVVGLLVVGGAIAAALTVFGGSDLELTIDTCEIAADGTLTAAGVVKGPNGTGVQIDVVFVDTATDEEVDTADASVDLSFGSAGNPWEATGSAGDDVQQVTCNVAAMG